MNQTDLNRPFLFNFVKWYGYIFSITFLLYGGVKIILGILDRQLDDVNQSIIFLLLGAALITITFAFRDCKTWGWYGLIGINCLVILGTVFNLGEFLNIVPLVLSLLSLVALFMPQTKEVIFLRH